VSAGSSGDGLPLGIQLIGKPWDEPTVMRAARVVEATISF
jgi:aspartyl-tRNA(Asn)/glutamyl-tRNA(Gln) amidotransferase subunit A